MNFVRFNKVETYGRIKIEAGVYLIHNDNGHVTRWVNRGCEVLESFEGEALEYPIAEGRVEIKEEVKVEEIVEEIVEVIEEEVKKNKKKNKKDKKIEEKVTEEVKVEETEEIDTHIDL